MQKQLTAIIEREGDGYMSLCSPVTVGRQPVGHLPHKALPKPLASAGRV
jgi:hypothetical protein